MALDGRNGNLRLGSHGLCADRTCSQRSTLCSLELSLIHICAALCALVAMTTATPASAASTQTQTQLPFTSPSLDDPIGVAVDMSGNVYVADYGSSHAYVLDVSNGNESYLCLLYTSRCV